MNKPLIAIIDWAESPLDDSNSAVERAIVGDAAVIKRFLCSSDADFEDEIYGADALIAWHNTPITEAGLSRLRNCKALIRNGVGFDSVDVQAAAQYGIPVCNVPDYGTEEVADHAIALSMALCRQLFPLDEEAKRLGLGDSNYTQSETNSRTHFWSRWFRTDRNGNRTSREGTRFSSLLL